jgi:hypothetical protein
MAGALLSKPSMQTHKSMKRSLQRKIRLPLATFFGLALCATALADDPLTEADQRLLAAMDAGYAYAKRAVPLADQEFEVLESHVKAPDPGHIVFWMYQPVMKALDETHHDTSLLRHYLRSKFPDESSQRTIMYVVVSQANEELHRLSSLGSVLLAEAIGGSPQQSQLVEQFIEGQRITSELQGALNWWMSSRMAAASASPEPSPSASPSGK